MSSCTDEQLDCFINEFKNQRTETELSSCAEVLKKYRLTPSQHQRAGTEYFLAKNKLKLAATNSPT